MPETLTTDPKAAETKILFTTPEEMEEFQLLNDDTRKWVRTGSRDKTLHRITHMFPEYTGVTGEDVVEFDTKDGKKVPGIGAIFKVNVERFTEKPGPDRKPVRTVLGSFIMAAKKFKAEFEAAE